MNRQTTNWNEMANYLIDAWVMTGNQLWKSWFELMSVCGNGQVNRDSLPEFPYLTQGLVNNQILKLSFAAWQEILSGQDGQDVLSKYTESLRIQLKQSFDKTAQTTQDTSQLWQLYLQEIQKLSQNWTVTMGTAVKPRSQKEQKTANPWIELNNLYWNLLSQSPFASLMQSPLFGPNREFNGKAFRAFEAWTNLYRGSSNYQLMLGDIQVRTFERVILELVSLAKKGKKVQDWQEFQQVGSRVADEVLEIELSKENNLKIRGDFLNALNAFRLSQLELLEIWLKTMNLPLRSEVDEVHQNIYHLRKEVKMLKQALAKYEQQEQLISELFQEVQALKQALAKDSESLITFKSG
jgi:class III poly(R)-hydroxyalkanoic acid synthase PhaE subunit